LTIHQQIFGAQSRSFEWEIGEIMSSKNLGLLSIAFSVVAMMVWGFGMRVFPAVSSLVFVGLQIAAISFAIVAALRGSKLWLMASAWPVLFTALLVKSILAE
jgi:hypothetical protein